MSGIVKPNLKYSLYTTFVDQISHIPCSHLAALGENWEEAMQDEYTALIKNKT